MVLELKIAPSGEVVDVKVLSSELKASELERKLLARIKQFDFGNKDVDVMVVSWPVDFLPRHEGLAANANIRARPQRFALG